jgi:predicted nuclease of predicted toxin-antitoxin system
MGVSYKVGQWLNNLGHDAIHISEQGLHTLDDPSIIKKAEEEDRIILTADVDFGQIVTFSRVSVSVIQFRLFDMSPENINAKLSLIFERFRDHLSRPIIITVQEGKIRFKNIGE